MIRKILSATCLVFVASSMAIADPPAGKGKPDKGGDDGGGDGGAFVPAWIHTDNLSGAGSGIVLSNKAFTTTRAIGASSTRVEDLAHDPSRGRVLLRDDRSIVEHLYSVNPSGSVSQLGSAVWYERIMPDVSDDVQTGLCVGLSDGGAGIYGFEERSRDTSGSLVITDAGLNERDENGTNERQAASGYFLTCDYLPNSDTIIASAWDNTNDVSALVRIDTQGLITPLVDVPNRISRVDIAANGGAFRYLITWHPANGDTTISEWDGVQSFAEARTVKVGAESASYVCDLGADGWPKGVIYRERNKNSWRWIEETNTRRQIGGRKSSWVQLQPVC